jgi:DNA polymerase
MILGEAPGKQEDATREPFTGPAGKLLDQIWTAAGMTTADWYITNVVLCRPVAPKGSGKQNLTPKVDQIKRCRWFLLSQLHLVQPKIVVALGRPATEAMLGIRGIRMGDYRGIKVKPDENLELKDTIVFPMIHPAAILHSQGTERYDQYRLQTWTDVQKLKKMVDQLQS